MPKTLESRTDEELVELYRRGAADALEILIRRHHDDLMRFLTRLVGERAGAEDVFQEAFLQVHTSVESFDTSRRFKPWLFTIAANKARDLLRRNTRRRTLDLSAPVAGRAGAENGGPTFVDLLSIDAPSVTEVSGRQERDRQVQEVVGDLPFMLREVLLLAYFQHLSYSQIAEALEIPLGTVKSRLHAAVGAFAKRWHALSKGEQPS